MAGFKVEMPQVGESVTEAIIAKWLVQPGDRVRKFDPLVEVVTDKVNMEVPAPTDGTLSEVLAPEGSTIAMGSVIAEMEVADGSPDALEQSKPQDDDQERAGRIGTMIVGANVGPTGGEFRDTSLGAQSETSTVAPNVPADRPKSTDETKAQRGNYSPVVTRLASRHGIDLSQISGTGRGGRVTKRDVEQYLETIAAHAPTPPAGELDAATVSADETTELSPVRRMIAEHMSRSIREIPHAWAAVEVDMSHVVRFRESQKERVQAATGCKLTYLPISLHVIARALKRHRRINSEWSDGHIVLKGDVNVGIAVAADHGLVVPVLKQADALNLESAVSACTRLIDAARANRLTVEEVRDGTFTLNNTGAFGSTLGGAIINHPQAAILNTESIVKRPVVVYDSHGGESIAIRPMMNLCLSFDHRIMDGAEAMAFLNDVKSHFESPSIATLD